MIDEEPNKEVVWEEVSIATPLVMGTEFLDLPSGDDNYRLGGAWHIDPASDQKTRTLQS
jgi:hypothetical protein